MTVVYSLPISSWEQGHNRPGTRSRTRKKTDDKAKAACPSTRMDNPYKRRKKEITHRLSRISCYLSLVDFRESPCKQGRLAAPR